MIGTVPNGMMDEVASGLLSDDTKLGGRPYGEFLEVYLVALALTAFFACSPATAQNWKEYTYSRYSIAVAFPAKPKAEATTYQAADGRLVKARTYSAMWDNSVFKVTIVDLSEAARDETAEIANAIKMLSQGGEIELDIPYRINQVYGRQLNIKGADGNYLSVALFYYKRRLYQIEGKAHSKDNDTRANVIRFQHSFNFTDYGTNR